MQLHSIRLLVDDVGSCFRFYRDVMGLEPVWGEQGGRYAEFRIGDGAVLALFEKARMAEAVDRLDRPAQAPGQDRAAVIIQVDDLDSTVAALGRKGAVFLAGPEDYTDWTIRAAHLRDPEDNLIELFEPLATTS